MVTWMLYRTAEWSLGCCNGLENGHLAVVTDSRMVTWLVYRTADWSRDRGNGLQNGHVAVVPD